MSNESAMSLEDEALRYADIYTRVERAVSKAQRHRDGAADRSPGEHSTTAAERAAT